MIFDDRMETTPDNKIYSLSKFSDSDRLWNATKGKNKQKKSELTTNNINFYKRTMFFVTPEKAAESNCIYITWHRNDYLSSRGAKHPKSLFSSRTSLDLGQELSVFLTKGKYATSWKMHNRVIPPAHSKLGHSADCMKNFKCLTTGICWSPFFAKWDM